MLLRHPCGNDKWAVGYMGQEFGGEIWDGDKNLRVLGLQMVIVLSVWPSIF